MHSNEHLSQDGSKRSQVIDVAKGCIMLLMCLDHVRLYFSNKSFLYAPTNIALTTGSLFFTRWITHLCEPVFCFSAGISAFMLSRRMSKAGLSVFLIKRGLWLILLELTIVNFGWHFDPLLRTFSFSVLWMLGASMVVLSLLIYLDDTKLLLICALTIVCYGFLDRIVTNEWVRALLLRPGLRFHSGTARYLLITDPLIPWFAVMAVGYLSGPLFLPDVAEAKQQKICTYIGCTCIGGFAILRLARQGSDPKPFVIYRDHIKTLLSFLNVTKYPPSQQYLLLMLGTFFLAIPLLRRLSGRPVKYLSVFGRVPLFFYVAHIYLIHALAMLAYVLGGHGAGPMLIRVWPTYQGELKGWGYGLGVIYLLWISLVFVLYPLCLRYGRWKIRNTNHWWSHYL